MQDLKIQLIINPSCELVAVDNTAYHNLKYDDANYLEDLTNHVSVEFLVDHLDNVVSNSIVIKNNLKPRRELVDGNISVFKFTNDGTFVYYKYLIPKLNHLLVVDENNIEYYKTQNQLFYHKGKIYYSKTEYDTIELVLSNSEEISDLCELWDIQGTQTFSFQKRVFSICKLQKCLVNLQRNIIKSSNVQNENWCIKNKLNDDKYLRDFLFASMYVLDYLKDNNNYEEAQRLINGISDCTSKLCLDDKTDCNCGKTI